MADNIWKELYPALTNEELQIARENLDAYLELAWEIYEDVQAQEGDGLTEAESRPTLLTKVDQKIN
jgi:hypothetical protein